MATRFRQISSLDGVDEGAGPNDAGIVVPVGGSNLVSLENGGHLSVRSDDSGKKLIHEIKEIAAADLAKVKGDVKARLSAAASILNSGARRLFITSGSSGGGAVSAINPRSGKAEAILQVVVMKPKPIVVSLRQIQIFKDAAHKDVITSAQDKFDPQAMLDHMNAVWTPQTNMSFTLGKTDAVTIAALPVGSDGPSRINPDHAKGLNEKRDEHADLTIFFAHKAFDPPAASHTPWQYFKNGYTSAQLGFCVVADGRLEFTVEHEEGHFFGALDAKGKYVADYGHSSGGDMMNVDIQSNGIIPVAMAKLFNKGFS